MRGARMRGREPGRAEDLKMRNVWARVYVGVYVYVSLYVYVCVYVYVLVYVYMYV